MNETIQEEKSTLIHYLKELESFIKKEKANLGNLFSNYKENLKDVVQAGSLDDRQETLSIAHRTMSRSRYNERWSYVHKLLKIEHSPYFARIDVKLEDDTDSKKYYIGKIGFKSKEREAEITDWRAPIASLYYNNAFATDGVSFNVSPFNALDVEKQITCDLKTRRTLEIENKEIINIYDDSLLQNVKTSEDFVLAKIKGKTGGVLEDIIETIQADQSEIIRFAPNKNVIVQGVAGSGKTTIAIHRISYLFYNFPNKIHASGTLFLSASKTLINYLSKSLPELDVFNIRKASVIEILKETLDKNQIKIKTRVENTIPEKLYFENIKEFNTLLNKYIDKKIEELKKQFSQEVIEKNNVNFYNIKTQFERFHDTPPFLKILNIEEDLRDTKKDLSSELRYSETKDVIKRRVNGLDLLQKDVSRFIKKINFETIYLDFLAEQYGKKPSNFDINHLSALYLLTLKIGGIKDQFDFNLVVLDEAQDLNILNFACIKSFSRGNSFNIFGDVNQSINKRFSIDNWDEINDIFKAENSQKFKLDISYRSTRQIMKKAGEILTFAGISDNIPKSVARDGNDVIEESFTNKQLIVKKIIEEITKLRTVSKKSIGIILTSEFPINDVSSKLNEANVSHEIITEFFDNFKKDSIYLVPVNLVKGLEFDSVFVLSFNSVDFSDKIEGVFKKFVCATRAMSNLFLYTTSL